MSSSDQPGRHRLPVGARVSLISQVSRAALWNATLLPILAVLNLAFAVLIRRRFGLFSGVYDVLLGLTSTVVQYSSIGIPTALSKFLPEVYEASGLTAPRRLLRDVMLVRVLLVIVALVPLNIFAEPLVQVLELGSSGRLYIGLVSGLVVTRAVLDLMLKTLNAFFSQMWSNLISLGQAALELAVVGIALALGHDMGGVFGGLVATGTAVAVFSVGRVFWQLTPFADTVESHELSFPDRDLATAWFAGEGGRFFRFSIFTYGIGLSGYFMDMGFVAPALAVLLSTEDVALFAMAFKLSFMTVGLVVASFRGIYRPLFARVRIRKDQRQLQETFTRISQAQLVVLLPAGLGLMVMAGDYVPLLFGVEFLPAVPLVWLLVAFLYTETAFNLSGIVLSIDEQYRAITWLRAPILLAAPLFLLTATRMGLLPATVIFGATRASLELLNYAFCRRLYGFQFPWAFAGKVGIVSVVMAVVLAVARTIWVTSIFEALTLTTVGAVIFFVGLRVASVLGPDELSLLNRTALPLPPWLISWFAPEDGYESAGQERKQ